MHLPDSMLHGAVCPVTLALSTAVLAGVAVAASRSRSRPTVFRFAAVTALVLAAQAVNFPIPGGTSGHLLGGVLASALLGVPSGVLSLALVVSVQALVLGDGGLWALGANVLNLALVGAGVGGLLFRFLERGTRSEGGRLAALALASWASAVLAAGSAGLQMALGGTGTLATAVPAMVGVHAAIGLGEGLAAAGLFALLSRSRGPALVAVTAAFLMAAPLGSTLPDGLQRTAAELSPSAAAD